MKWLKSQDAASGGFWSTTVEVVNESDFCFWDSSAMDDAGAKSSLSRIGLAPSSRHPRSKFFFFLGRWCPWCLTRGLQLQKELEILTTWIPEIVHTEDVALWQPVDKFRCRSLQLLKDGWGSVNVNRFFWVRLVTWKHFSPHFIFI